MMCSTDCQETGGDLKKHEITLAYQLGKESTIPNVLERNYWETEDSSASRDKMDIDETAEVDGVQQPRFVARTRVRREPGRLLTYRSNSRRKRSRAFVPWELSLHVGLNPSRI